MGFAILFKSVFSQWEQAFRIIMAEGTLRGTQGYWMAMINISILSTRIPHVLIAEHSKISNLADRSGTS